MVTTERTNNKKYQSFYLGYPLYRYLVKLQILPLCMAKKQQCYQKSLALYQNIVH